MNEAPKDHWIIRLLFDIPTDATQRARDLLVAYITLVLGIALSSFLALKTIDGTRSGLADRDSLLEVHGTLQATKNLKSTIHFSLHEHPHKFIYPSKAGDGLSVLAALRASEHLRLWHERPNEKYRTGVDLLNVLQIEADGVIVRRYEDVERAWLEDNRLVPWMLAVFVGMTLYLFCYVIIARRKKA